MSFYYSIEGIVGVVFFLGCSVFTLYHSKRVGSFTTLHFSIVGLATLYGLGLPLVVHGAWRYHPKGSNFLLESYDFIVLHTAFATVALAGIFVGWKLFASWGRRSAATFFNRTSEMVVVPWLFVMLAIAVIAMYFYTRDYGGFIGYFSYSRLIRSAHFDLVDRSSFSFLKPFGGFATISVIGFWGLILSGNRRLLYYLGFLLSFVVSGYVLLAFSGRLSMLMFISIFPISFAIYRRAKPLTWSLLLPISAPLAVVGIFYISSFFELKSDVNLEKFVVSEVSFPFIAFFAQFQDGDKFQFFYHLFVAPLYLLPSTFVGDWLSTASQVNTEIIHGAAKGVGGVTAGMPVDLITFGLMQFHVLGVFIYAMVFGCMLRGLTCVAGSFASRGMASAFSAYVAIRVGIFGAFYADPKHFIEGNFAFIATLLAILAFRSVRLKRS